MDVTLPGDDDPRRQAIRDFLADHPQPSGRDLAYAGLVAPHWPQPWGLDADPVHQLVVDEELRRAGARRPSNPIGIGWAGPTILVAGTDEQRERYLFPLLAGDEIWCQLFSEPDAGSDLASLTTTAERDGDHYVVTGQKIWTTFAHQATFGILLARTRRTEDRHDGITYLVCPMDSPGVDVRPIVDMTGTHEFNEVFLDAVRIPVANRVGEEHHGWELARVTLANERVSLSSGGALWGTGPDAHDLLDLVRKHGGVADPLMRQRLAGLYGQSEVLRLIRLRGLAAQLDARRPGPESSVRKLLADLHGQELMAVAKDLGAAHALLADAGPFGAPARRWNFGFLFSRALTIGGGTAEVQRNILAERVLGLPSEPSRS